MIDRRKFIKSASLLAGTLPFIKPLNFSKFAKETKISQVDKPIVISTWDFGLPGKSLIRAEERSMLLKQVLKSQKATLKSILSVTADCLTAMGT
jgi:hypothetical protein